jgi:hypothetical protein
VWNECGRADHNRTIEKAPEKALLTGKRQVHDFVSNCFERISLGNELGKFSVSVRTTAPSQGVLIVA